MSEDRVFQRHQQKIYFQNADMDFYFLWVFAYQGYGGAEEGECFYTASRIKEGNPKTWVKMWAEMANRIEAQSTTIKKRTSGEFAESLLASFYYYRAMAFCLGANDFKYYETWQKSLAPKSIIYFYNNGK